MRCFKNLHRSVRDYTLSWIQSHTHRIEIGRLQVYAKMKESRCIKMLVIHCLNSMILLKQARNAKIMEIFRSSLKTL